MRAIGDILVADNATMLGDVVAEPEVNIWYGCVVRGDLARISLGRRVNLQDGCLLHTDRDEPQVLDAGVVVGHGAILHGRHIGADTLIGMGAILLSRCDIGAECLIAAGSLVGEGKVIPPRSLVAGVPGRILRTVTDDEVARTREIAQHYVELARRHARGEVTRPFGTPS